LGNLKDSPLISSVGLLDSAFGLYRHARFPATAALCRRGLVDDPADGNCLNLLALAARGSGHTGSVVHLFGRALAAFPATSQTHCHLANVLYEEDRLKEASIHYHLALALSPSAAETLFNMAILLRREGQESLAERLYRRCLAVRHDFGEAHYNLGNLLRDSGQLDEARQSYRSALRCEPRFVDALINLANLLREQSRNQEAVPLLRRALTEAPDHPLIHLALAEVSRQTGQWRQTATSYLRTISLRSDQAASWNGLALVCHAEGRLLAAETAFQAAIVIDPQHGDAFSRQGAICHLDDRHRAASVCFGRALALKPDFAQAANNQALLLNDLGQPVEAAAYFRRALAIDPGYANARWNFALLLLADGLMPEGWRFYEARSELEEPIIERLQLPVPEWQGEPLDGRSLLIWFEQGYGDEIQFCRFAAFLKKRWAVHITLCCPPPLFTLFASLAGVDVLHPAETGTLTLARPDFWTFPMSIPRQIGLALESIPADLPYLWPPAERLAKWRRRLPTDGLTVGLVWKGSAGHKNDQWRSLPGLDVLAPLWTVAGVSFVSLQKGRGEDEAASPPAGQPLRSFSGDVLDFADSAAIISHLDLVITVDTAVAHLAGALGKPCWVMLPAIRADWRWLRDRQDTPWYPGTLRLFRQQTPGDWPAVIRRVASELQRLADPPQDVFNKALYYLSAGNAVQARTMYRRVLAIEPAHADSHHLLGILDHFDGLPVSAERRIDQAVRLQESKAEYHNNLGEVLRRSGRLDEAEGAFRRAAELQTDYAEAQYNLGVLWRDRGHSLVAARQYERALILRPDYVEALHGAGILLQQKGRQDAAQVKYRRALMANSSDANVLTNLGNVYRDQGRLEQALYCYRRLLVLHPASADGINNVGSVLQDWGNVEEAARMFEWAEVISINSFAAKTNAIFNALYRPGVGLAELHTRAVAWGASISAPKEHRTAVERNSKRPRLGFVSGDFRAHAVGFLVLPALEGLRGSGYEVFCYSNNGRQDKVTSRFRQAAGTWRLIAGQDDDEVIRQIIDDGIDILFDLSGYSAGNRLPVFARKPAPLQLSWIGFPGTTGLAEMDYLLGDRHQLPEGCDAFYSEKIIRLPDSHHLFRAPDFSPPSTPLPALANGFVTFGSFNAVKKISPASVALWSRILQALPTALLLLKTPALSHPQAADRLVQAFVGQGIARRRLRLMGASTPARHMAAMGEADIALDSFPYSGGQTTLECLWMGLPVVTLPGETFASRHSLSALATLELMELVARDAEDYQAIAVHLAANLVQLASMRGGMRDRMLRSPLCDAKRFIDHLDKALTTVWQRHRAEKKPCSMDFSRGADV